MFNQWKMKKDRKELEQEYENLKLLASFHEAYGISPK